MAGCLSCHTRELSPHVSGWYASRHQQAGVGCVACHRGDISPDVAPEAHDESDFTRAGRARTEKMCGRCHMEVLRVFAASALGQRSGKRRKMPTCLTCHAPLGSELLKGREVRRRCAECHQFGGEAGHLDIPARAESLLNDLDRLSLTRVLVLQAVLGREAQGEDMSVARRQFAHIDASIGDPILEWHRFDLVRVDLKTRHMIEELGELYEGIGSP